MESPRHLLVYFIYLFTTAGKMAEIFKSACNYMVAKGPILMEKENSGATSLLLYLFSQSRALGRNFQFFRNSTSKSHPKAVKYVVKCSTQEPT